MEKQINVYILHIIAHKVKCYLKREEILPFEVTWINVINIMLTEISHTERQTCIISLIYGIQKSQAPRN
jgi:hypothetical protein